MFSVKEDPIENRQKRLDVRCFPVLFPIRNYGEFHPQQEKLCHNEFIQHPGVLFFVVGLFSGCVLVCIVVARLFVWVGWLGVFSFLFSLSSSWCAMHLYVHTSTLT